MESLETEIISEEDFLISSNGSVKESLRKDVVEEYKMLRYYGDLYSINKELVKEALNKKAYTIDELINLKRDCMKGYLSTSLKNTENNKILEGSKEKLERGIREGYFSKKEVDNALRKHDNGRVDMKTFKIEYNKSVF